MRSGISSKDLAARLGRASSFVSQIENNRNKSPKYETAYDMLKILGVEEKDIESKLQAFNIYSPEYYDAQLRQFEEYQEHEAERAEELANDPEYQEHMAKQDANREDQERQEFFKNNGNKEYWGESPSGVWFNWFDKDDMEKQIKEIKVTLDSLANTPVNDNVKIIGNMNALITKMREDKELFDFFSSLFSEDYSVVQQHKREKIIKEINKIVRDGF